MAAAAPSATDAVASVVEHPGANLQQYETAEQLLQECRNLMHEVLIRYEHLLDEDSPKGRFLGKLYKFREALDTKPKEHDQCPRDLSSIRATLFEHVAATTRDSDVFDFLGKTNASSSEVAECCRSVIELCNELLEQDLELAEGGMLGKDILNGGSDLVEQLMGLNERRRIDQHGALDELATSARGIFNEDLRAWLTALKQSAAFFQQEGMASIRSESSAGAASPTECLVDDAAFGALDVPTSSCGEAGHPLFPLIQACKAACLLTGAPLQISDDLLQGVNQLLKFMRDVTQSPGEPAPALSTVTEFVTMVEMWLDQNLPQGGGSAKAFGRPNFGGIASLGRDCALLLESESFDAPTPSQDSWPALPFSEFEAQDAEQQKTMRHVLRLYSNLKCVFPQGCQRSEGAIEQGDQNLPSSRTPEHVKGTWCTLSEEGVPQDVWKVFELGKRHRNFQGYCVNLKGILKQVSREAFLTKQVLSCRGQFGLKREVALEMTAFPEFHEARASTKLGFKFITPYIHGLSLENLRQLRLWPGVPIETKLKLCGMALDEVAALHSSGTCHLDLKPANIILNLALGGEVLDAVLDLSLDPTQGLQRVGALTLEEIESELLTAIVAQVHSGAARVCIIDCEGCMVATSDGQSVRQVVETFSLSKNLKVLGTAAFTPPEIANPKDPDFKHLSMGDVMAWDLWSMACLALAMLGFDLPSSGLEGVKHSGILAQLGEEGDTAPLALLREDGGLPSDDVSKFLRASGLGGVVRKLLDLDFSNRLLSERRERETSGEAAEACAGAGSSRPEFPRSMWGIATKQASAAFLEAAERVGARPGSRHPLVQELSHEKGCVYLAFKQVVEAGQVPPRCVLPLSEEVLALPVFSRLLEGEVTKTSPGRVVDLRAVVGPCQSTQGWASSDVCHALAKVLEAMGVPDAGAGDASLSDESQPTMLSLLVVSELVKDLRYHGNEEVWGRIREVITNDSLAVLDSACDSRSADAVLSPGGAATRTFKWSYPQSGKSTNLLLRLLQATVDAIAGGDMHAGSEPGLLEKVKEFLNVALLNPAAVQELVGGVRSESVASEVVAASEALKNLADYPGIVAVATDITRAFQAQAITLESCCRSILEGEADSKAALQQLEQLSEGSAPEVCGIATASGEAKKPARHNARGDLVQLVKRCLLGQDQCDAWDKLKQDRDRLLRALRVLEKPKQMDIEWLLLAAVCKWCKELGDGDSAELLEAVWEAVDSCLEAETSVEVPVAPIKYLLTASVELERDDCVDLEALMESRAGKLALAIFASGDGTAVDETFALLLHPLERKLQAGRESVEELEKELADAKAA